MLSGVGGLSLTTCLMEYGRERAVLMFGLADPLIPKAARSLQITSIVGFARTKGGSA